MTLLRGIASIAAGFFALPLLMRVALGLVALVWPDAAQPAATATAPSPDFLRLNLGLTGTMAALSAVITASIAPAPRYLWVLLLAFLVFLGGLVLGVTQIGGPFPTWYLLGMPLVSGLAIAFGGWAWLARPRDKAR